MGNFQVVHHISPLSNSTTEIVRNRSTLFRQQL